MTSEAALRITTPRLTTDRARGVRPANQTDSRVCGNASDIGRAAPPTRRHACTARGATRRGRKNSAVFRSDSRVAADRACGFGRDAAPTDARGRCAITSSVAPTRRHACTRWRHKRTDFSAATSAAADSARGFGRRQERQTSVTWVTAAPPKDTQAPNGAASRSSACHPSKFATETARNTRVGDGERHARVATLDATFGGGPPAGQRSSPTGRRRPLGCFAGHHVATVPAPGDMCNFQRGGGYREKK